MNECDLAEDSCADQATCTNTVGSYTCACNPGYEGNGEVCTDRDECLDGSNDCSPFADCANTQGSFGCTCRSGYQGTGIGRRLKELQLRDAASPGRRAVHT